MSLKTLIQEILHPSAAVKAFEVTLFGNAVTVASDSDLGSTTLKAIHDAEDQSTAVGKIGAAIEDVTPLIVKLVEGGGVKAIVSDAETIAREVIEQFLAQLKQTVRC